jgi:DNA-binding GntR family transcriptional regulator
VKPLQESGSIEKCLESSHVDKDPSLLKRIQQIARQTLTARSKLDTKSKIRTNRVAGHNFRVMYLRGSLVMPVITPVKSVPDQIINRLRGELLSGQHAPGTPMREETLAERFGVSRMPIRNALQQLVHEGLLIAKRNCGVSVALPPAEVVTELLNPLRVQIETYALRLCLPVMNASQFDGLQSIIDTMTLACRQKDDAAVIDNDFAFHQFLLSAAGLDDIVPVWKGVVARMRDFHIQGNRTHADYAFIPFVHENLLGVFRSGDVEAAARALASHIENGEFNKKAIQAWNSRG